VFGSALFAAAAADVAAAAAAAASAALGTVSRRLCEVQLPLARQHLGFCASWAQVQPSPQPLLESVWP